MKKLMVMLMAVLFFGSTTGLVMAQDAASTPAAAKTEKAHKGGKKGHKGGKKSKKGSGTTTPPPK